MDLFIVHDDGREQLVASGLDAGDVGEIEEWWRYTKPFGHGIKIVVKQDLYPVAGLTATGTESGPAVEAAPPKSMLADGARSSRNQLQRELRGTRASGPV
jgi:hypothetical protein